MNRKTILWLIVVAAIVAVVSGASLIVGNNSAPASAGAPVGFIH
jgi:hypothetical protein